MNDRMTQALARLDPERREEVGHIVEAGAGSVANRLAVAVVENRLSRDQRTSCLWLLAQTSDDAAKALIVPLLESAEEREQAAGLAQVIISMEALPLTALVAIVEGNAHYEARLAAVHALGYGDHRIADCVLAVASDTAEATEIRGFAIEALGNLGLEEYFEALARLAKEDDPEIRYWVAYALGEIGAPAGIATLEFLVTDKRSVRESSVAEEAAASLAILRHQDS